MKVLRPFKGRVLESILIIAAVAVAAAAVMVVASLLIVTKRAETDFNESLYARQITVQPRDDDSGAFYLSSVPADVREIGLEEGSAPKLTLADLAAVKAAAPTVTGAYLADYDPFALGGLGDTDTLFVSKVTPEFQTVAGLDVSEGSLISAADFEKHNHVMLLRPSSVRKLKLKPPVVGQDVTFGQGRGTYKVIGILKEDGQADEPFQEGYVPWEPQAWSDISQLTFSVAKAADVPQAQSEIRAYSDKTWGETISVRSNAEVNWAYFEQEHTRSLVTAVFASLGLVTAALSIMSLMLARVLRRNREIGVLRSLGATRRAIRDRFLGEALTLGVLGGLLGVAAGYGLYTVYREYLIGLNDSYRDYLNFSVPAALAAFGLALAVSLLFGLYPAVLASRIGVVDALKEA